MKLEIKGYKEDIEAFKEMLIVYKPCCFLNNDDVSCLSDITCTECIESHIDFIEKHKEDKS